jgi:hypothetical protein
VNRISSFSCIFLVIRTLSTSSAFCSQTLFIFHPSTDWKPSFRTRKRTLSTKTQPLACKRMEDAGYLRTEQYWFTNQNRSSRQINYKKLLISFCARVQCHREATATIWSESRLWPSWTQLISDIALRVRSYRTRMSERKVLNIVSGPETNRAKRILRKLQRAFTIYIIHQTLLQCWSTEG